jgi:integrase
MLYRRIRRANKRQTVSGGLQMSNQGSKKGRAKGDGYVFKRSSVYYLQYDVNGKRKKISLGVNDKRDAERKAKEILEPIRMAETKEQIAIHIGEAKKLLTKKRIPIDDVWSKFDLKFQRTVAPGTKDNYCRHWNSFKAWVKTTHPEVKYLNDITGDIAIEYTNKLKDEDKLSGSTFNQHRCTLRMIHNFLSSELGSSENIWDEIPRAANDGISRKELNEKQILEVLAKFDDEDFYLLNKAEMRVMFHLGTWTGLRLADCAQMRWECVNLEQNQITCVPVKTKRHGTTVIIPIHPSLREQLSLAWEWKEDEFLLPKVLERYGRNPHGVKMDVLKVFQKCGLETSIHVEGRKMKANQIGFHSFRHSFVSFCANAGVPLPVVQSLVGHGNPAITRHYIHVGEEATKQAVAALPGGDPNKPKSADERIREAMALLSGNYNLSDTEQKVMQILAS